ncbi:MAG: hypothetical protein ACR2LK_07950 [Solirubrobacteraceae bacterium]
MSLTEKAEAEEILWPRLNALEALPWHELDSYGEKEEVVDAPGGRRFRIVTGAFWDMDEWASGNGALRQGVRRVGFRRLFPYTLWASRVGADDPVPEPPEGWLPEQQIAAFRFRRRGFRGRSASR